jgi:arylsulfatase
MVELWWEEAEKYQVLPLDNRPYVAIIEPPPTGLRERSRYVYRPGGSRVPEEVAADVKGRSHTIVADVQIPDGGAEGVLLAMGSILGGYSLFVQDGHLHYVHNYLGREEHALSSERRVTPGRHELGFAFESQGRFKGGSARLTIDGETVGTGVIPHFTPVRFSITDAGLTCGEDGGSAVTHRYRAPFTFTGTVRRVVVEAEGEPVIDPDAAVESKLRTQ